MNGFTMWSRGGRGPILCGAVLVVLVGVAACGPPAPVVQGKAVSIAGSLLGIADETRPDAPPVVVDIATAELGAPPVVGDLVRVVYRQEAGGNRALAVMNLTREERTSGGSR